MDGELLTLPDGKKQIWSDYGHRKCISAYPDIQTYR
jgi:hypothetical protein